jgi:hypothetical protein
MLFPEFATKPCGGSGKSQSQGNGERSELPTFVIIECSVCQTRIRVDVTRSINRGQIFRCKHCDTRYSIGLAESDGFAVLIVPFLATHEQSASADFRPAHIVDALRTLNLPPDSEWNAIRQRYRQLVAQYHPDKVQHLGDELRKVAINKTKEFNQSFSILEGFFQSQ